MADVQKFSRLTLTAMVVGSMVGAGIFSLPARFGAATGTVRRHHRLAHRRRRHADAGLRVQSLAVRKPDLDAGIYAYPKAASATTWASRRRSGSGPAPVSATSRIHPDHVHAGKDLPVLERGTRWSRWRFPP